MTQDLRDDLEIACMDALRGDPPGPGVAARLQLVCTEVLRKRGITGFRVEAVSDRKQTAVMILLPKPNRRVEQVVLKIA
jgi:hypothetical protein